jgi:cytochrome c biogenesis factor
MEDLYLIFSSENGDEQGSVTLRVYINPLIGWAWMALPIFTLGVGISLTYRPKRLLDSENILKERYIAAQVTG